VTAATHLAWGVLGAILTYALITVAAIGLIAGTRAARGHCPRCGRTQPATPDTET